ncbi:hypothetical protein ScPMuIL_016123 [Solemya velum]
MLALKLLFVPWRFECGSDTHKRVDMTHLVCSCLPACIAASGFNVSQIIVPTNATKIKSLTNNIEELLVFKQKETDVVSISFTEVFTTLTRNCSNIQLYKGPCLDDDLLGSFCDRMTPVFRDEKNRFIRMRFETGIRLPPQVTFEVKTCSDLVESTSQLILTNIPAVMNSTSSSKYFKNGCSSVYSSIVWRMVAPPGYIWVISMKQALFDGDGLSCNGDKMRINLGHENRTQDYCRQFSSSLITEGGVDRIEFVPAANFTMRYFDITYRLLERPESLRCIRSYEASHILIASRRWKMNFHEEWMILKENKHDRIHIRFDNVDLHSSERCGGGDHARVWTSFKDATGCSSQSQGTDVICNNTTADFYIRGDNNARITFETDGDNIDHTGFTFWVLSMPKRNYNLFLLCTRERERGATVSSRQIHAFLNEYSYGPTHLKSYKSSSNAMLVRVVLQESGITGFNLTYGADSDQDDLCIEMVPKTLIATQTHNFIYSSGYPHIYPRLSEQEWIIVKPNAKDTLVLNVTESSIEFSAGCTKDVIQILEGACKNGYLIARLCGRNKTIYYDSYNKYFRIRFKSDGEVEDAGFKLVYYISEYYGEPKSSLPLYGAVLISVFILVIGLVLGLVICHRKRTSNNTAGNNHTQIQMSPVRSIQTVNEPVRLDDLPPSYEEVCKDGSTLTQSDNPNGESPGTNSTELMMDTVAHIAHL